VDEALDYEKFIEIDWSFWGEALDLRGGEVGKFEFDCGLIG
jgi:hypothetical protein